MFHFITTDKWRQTFPGGYAGIMLPDRVRIDRPTLHLNRKNKDRSQLKKNTKRPLYVVYAPDGAHLDAVKKMKFKRISSCLIPKQVWHRRPFFSLILN